MASGASLNRVGNRGGKKLLVASGDGTYDSGFVMNEAIGFSKWLFQWTPTGSAAPSASGWSVTCYGTIDPAVYDLNDALTQTGVKGTLPTTSWVQIPAPSVEGTSPDASTWANPLTASTQALYTNAPWVAVRVVAVGSTSTGGITVFAFAVP